MEQKQKNFKSLLTFGEDGEHEIAEYLMKKYNISVLPLYQFNNDKAPLMFSIKDSFTLPDLTCFNDGKVYFVEVKTKNQWVSYKGVVETGLDYRLYLEYLKVKRNTKLNINIIFNHKEESPVGYYLSELEAYSRVWDGKVKGEKRFNAMVFYNQNTLMKI